jgi:large repetitive protein
MSRNRSSHSPRSWFDRLTTIFVGVGRTPVAKRQPNQRNLRIEVLEQRSLLSADVLASIAGKVFYDVAGDGLTAADVGLASVTVKLYRDGGNGVFDGSTPGSDDTLVASQLTDSAGNYRFDSLAAGKYFVQQSLAAGFVLKSGTDISTVTIASADLDGSRGVVIDSFDTSSQAAASFSHGRTAVATVIAPEAIGGQRDLLAQLTTPHGSVAMGANTEIPGVLDFSAGSASNGIREVVWDGPNTDAQHLNPNGLGGVDLTRGNTSTGIRLVLGADHNGGTAVFKIYSDANNWSSATIAIANTDDGTASQQAFVPFANFTVGGGSGANFSKVGAIQLDINGPNAVDGQVDSIEAVGPKVFTSNFANLAQADLGIVKSESPQPAVAGQQLTYTLKASNSGPSNATGVTVSDALPAGVTFVSATSSQGTVDFANGILTIHLGSLASGAGATTTVLVGVAPGTTGILNNTVTITGNETDPNPGNNTSTVTTQLNAQIDLAIVKTGAPDPVTAGQQLTYTLTSVNNGPSSATGVTVSDALPAGVTFVSATSSQGAVSFANGTVTVGLGNLAAGATASSTIIVGVNAATTGSITNTAVIHGIEQETDLANNQSSVTTTVNAPVIIQGDPEIDLAITKAASASNVSVGGSLTYTLTVLNLGPATATGVTLVDALPSGVTVTTTSSSQGSVTTSNGAIRASLGTLAKNASATVTIVTIVNPGAALSLLNAASVSGDQDESNLSNNEDTVVTQILPTLLSKRRFLGR